MKGFSKSLMKPTLLPILLCALMPGALLAGNPLDKTGNPTATPIVAFSVRQLSSAYAGSAMQVRRSSDNTTRDIGFTTSGDLDTATLKAFVGSGAGYVTIWYDQSGNSLNAVQPTNADQPTIMSGGVINRDNGQPSVYTNGGTGFLYFQPVTILNGTTQVTRMEVTRSRSSSFGITEGLGHFQLDLQLFPTYAMVQYETGNITISSSTMSSTTALMSINSVRTSGASQLYVNTILQGTSGAGLLTLSSPDTGYIGVRWDYKLGNAGPGAFSETILFNSVLPDSDRQAINYNENWYYSLGYAPCSSTRASLSTNGTTTKALYACSLGLWNYYYDPAHPLNLLFGIEKDPGNTGANPTFMVDSVNLTAAPDPTTQVFDALAATDGITALGRYWNVYTRTPLTSPVSIQFFYNPPDTLAARKLALDWKAAMGLSMVSNLQWFKTIGDPYTPDSLTATPIPTVKGPFTNLTPVYGTTNGINYAEFDGVTSFNGVSGGTGVYIISNTMITLPVTISSFTGRRVNQTTLLSWAMASESNTDRFEVVRSADGSTWLQIGQVPAAGNSSTPLSYQYVDPVALQGGNGLYYRLRLVYKDGQYTYSDVVLIEADGNSVGTPQLLKITPNPFGSELEITCTLHGSAPVEVQLRDMTGAILIRQEYTPNKGYNVFTLTNLNGLAKGTYVVRVVQGGTVGIRKVVKL